VHLLVSEQYTSAESSFTFNTDLATMKL